MTSHSDPDRRWRAFVTQVDVPYVHLSSGIARTIGDRKFVEYGTHFWPLDEWHESEADAVRSTLPKLLKLHATLSELISAVSEGRKTPASPGDSGKPAAGAALPEVAT